MNTKFLAGVVSMMVLVPGLSLASDFPTQARVEYVLRCMSAHGEQTYDTLYPCICAIDKIAAEFSYDEYVEAEVFAMLRPTPGERGAVFRDPARAKVLAKKFTEATEGAESSCFVKPSPSG
jgi:hypothetical protein